jgi:hypothetical protein
MHPVNILFEDIYRDYWGIDSLKVRRVECTRATMPAVFRPFLVRRDERRR